jgi:hypothetical protein
MGGVDCFALLCRARNDLHIIKLEVIARIRQLAETKQSYAIGQDIREICTF